MFPWTQKAEGSLKFKFINIKILKAHNKSKNKLQLRNKKKLKYKLS